MNKLAFLVFSAFTFFHYGYGLSCWECNNARTNDECIRNGSLNFCLEIDAICEDQVRHYRGGRTIVIEKRCKQAHACNNNVIQNLRPATPIQCQIEGQSSVCRCCCSSDACNRNLLTCWTAYPPFRGPNCPRFPNVPENGNMQCRGNREPGTTCDYTCHTDHLMEGRTRLTCLSNGKWDYPPPKCNLKTCRPERFTLGNGTVTCSNKNYLRSRCTFKCNTDYALVGSEYSTCNDVSPSSLFGRWSAPPPRCRPLICPRQGPLLHGSFRCTQRNKFMSTCSWRCNENYEIFPKGFDQNTCLFNGAWNRPWPCCTRPCLPFAVVDLMIILDSSSSVGDDNWQRMTDFVASLFDRFALGPEAGQFSSFRYNAEVDTRSAIYFSNYTRDKAAFLRAFRRIPYDGSGTNTGTALLYAVNTALKIGNRPEAPDIVLLITDGNSQDSVREPGRLLRATGADVRVLPVRPPGGGEINIDDMIQIAGSRDRVILTALEGGFGALDATFAQNLAQNLCPPPCVNPFHPLPGERVTPRRLLPYINTTQLQG